VTAPTEHHDTAQDFDPETGALPWDGGGVKDGRIVSIEGLDRMGDHLVAIERGITENRALHEAAVRRLEERLERIQAPLRRDVARIRTMVEAFAQEQGRKGICIDKAKTRELPSGLVLAWVERKKGTYRYDQRLGPDGKPPTPTQNRERLVAWAEGEQACRDEDLIPLIDPGPPVPNLEEIKRHAATIRIAGVADVFVPPGLEYVPPGEVLTVTTKGESK